MPLKPFTYVGSNNAVISAYVSCPTKPKGIVQIVHGMAEHAQRYSDFAEYLASAGFAVYANDHRGHGATAKNEGLPGYFADKAGWQLVVDDLHALTELAREKHPNLPIFLLGHSMGTLLVRSYIERYGSGLSGIILSSTTLSKGTLITFAKILAQLECMLHGPTRPSQLLHNLTFGPFIKSVKDHRTDYDWLSRDVYVVDDYINDPLCGGVFTAGFFLDLISGIQKTSKPEAYKAIPKELPVLLLAGTEDPMSHNGEDHALLAFILESAGNTNVTQRLYEGARHELLNEINRQEVYTDIVHWLHLQLWLGANHS